MGTTGNVSYPQVKILHINLIQNKLQMSKVECHTEKFVILPSDGASIRKQIAIYLHLTCYQHTKVKNACHNKLRVIMDHHMHRECVL